MSKANYKKTAKKNSFNCGCCFNGVRDWSCRLLKKRTRQQGKKEVKDELEKQG